MGKHLAEVMQQRMQKLDIQHIREVARRSGGRISHSSATMIYNGIDKTFAPDTIRGLAVALNMAPTPLFDAYWIDVAARPQSTFTLPAKTNALSALSKRALLAYSDFLLAHEALIAHKAPQPDGPRTHGNATGDLDQSPTRQEIDP